MEDDGGIGSFMNAGGRSTRGGAAGFPNMGGFGGMPGFNMGSAKKGGGRGGGRGGPSFQFGQM